MRILLTTDTIGGVWTFNRELTSYLLFQGHKVVLVILGPPPSELQTQWCSNKAVSFPARFTFEVVPVALEWMQDNSGSYSAAEAVLLRLVKEFLPDVLHCSQFCFGGLPVHVPKIVTAHSDVLSWASACRPEGLELSKWFTQYCSLVEHGLLGCDALVAPTRWMLRELAFHFELPATRFAVHNGIALPSLVPPAERLLQAVTVGRLWDEAKNLLLLTNLQAPLPILAAGECSHEADNAPSSVGSLTMLGWVEEEELLSIFQQSSIYIAPSIYEPFGLAPLEAALCGCAVLLNDIPTFREVWGDSALYFAGAESLNRQLDRLVNNPSLLERACSRAYKRAVELTASCTARKYLALYEKLVGLNHSENIEEVASHAS